MDAKFRPIPITILDILAIFLPGFVWLVLIATFFEALNYPRDGAAPTPVLAWEHIIGSLKDAGTWFAPFPLLVASLLLGYLLKPAAIVITEQVATQWVVRRRYAREMAESEGKRGREAAQSPGGPAPGAVAQEFYTGLFRRLKFPFNGVFYGTDLYEALQGLLKDRLDCDPQPFMGRQMFATAKSYLKAVSPTMWEESERREAEVRMAGVMYLASLFSSALSVCVLAAEAYFRGRLLGGPSLDVLGWLLVSAAGVLVTGESFSLLRVSEVGYTYLNALVACKRGRDGDAPQAG